MAFAPFSAASRAGNCAMIALRSLSLKATQPATSSSERPQPMQIRVAGWTTQTRLQGDEMLDLPVIEDSA